MVATGAPRHLEVQNVRRGLRLSQPHHAAIISQVAVKVVRAWKFGMQQHVRVVGRQGVITGVPLLLLLLLLLRMRVVKWQDLLPLVLVQTERAVRRRGTGGLRLLMT